MNIPKVKAATPIDNHTLIVQFDNGAKKKYDILPLLSNEMFAPLKNESLFKAVQVEKGGYAISWNNEIDLSEHELWLHGETVP